MKGGDGNLTDEEFGDDITATNSKIIVFSFMFVVS
jgi:hypothetical protein